MTTAKQEREVVQTLTVPTFATQIHPKTGSEIADTKLQPGQRYRFLSRQEDANGKWWLRIEIEGLFYEVACPYSHVMSGTCTHIVANYPAE